MFSRGIEFSTTDAHSIIDRATGKRINPAQDISVGDHVWIGADSKILKGVTIEHNCIIGTNSIVTKKIPAYSAAAGVPARVVRNNIDWSRERTYDF